jgi:G3E family GTPase
VFRAKGLIRVYESEKPYIFHLVGKRFTLDESDRVGAVKSRLVLIGRNLDRQQLLHRLQQCVVG